MMMGIKYIECCYIFDKQCCYTGQDRTSVPHEFVSSHIIEVSEDENIYKK